MATLQELKERWDGTSACLLRTDEVDPANARIKIFIKKSGVFELYQSNYAVGRLTLDKLLDDRWELKYPLSLHTDDVIKVLENLNPELRYARGVWYSRQRSDILDTLHAICRSCGIEINGKLEWKE